MIDVVYSVAEFLDNCLGVSWGYWLFIQYEIVAACIMVVSRFQTVFLYRV